MSRLLQPLVYRNGISAANRIMLAAMSTSQSLADGSLGREELFWLDMRSRGGFGTLITCGAHVAPEGQAFPGQLGACGDAHEPGLRRLAEVLSSQGALPMLQLFHAGWRADEGLMGRQPWSASEQGGARAATDADIEAAIAAFAAAAARAQRAGMAGVEILAGRGYLLCQFLSRSENRRADAWGGTARNRMRLTLAVMRAVRTAVADDFVVGVRISPEDLGYAAGLDLDESLELAGSLCAEGADFISLSLGDWRDNAAKRPRSHPLQEFRNVVPPNIALIAAGLILTRDDAERVLDLGADAVALARAAMVNPDWPRRIADPAWQPVALPVDEAHLLACGASPGFVQRMRERGGIVA